MSSPKFPEPPPSIPATSLERCDELLTRLASKKEEWVGVPISERIALLKQTIVCSVAEAEGWVRTACQAKGVDYDSPRSGEEWLGGPMTFVRNLRLLVETLEHNGAPPPPRTWKRPSGQEVAQAFPANTIDKLFFQGVTGEVWMEPGKPISQGRIYREKAAGKKHDGKVALVLGAGNVASIGPMDALYKLFAEDEVVLLKTNPVNAYLGPFIERSFKPFMDRGFFAVVHGGAEVGAHLTNHALVDTIHITGSDATHDAIVWGPDRELAKQRKAAGTPVNTKPITSELGCVTPVLIVPGPWTAADIKFQARHVAAMVTNNASFNCNAAKVLVTAAGWDLRDRFVDAVHEQLAKVAPRKAYYPGARARYEAFLSNYPQSKPLGEQAPDVVPWTVIPNVPAKGTEYALSNEAFCGVLADVALDAKDGGEFLEKATRFANDDCWGSLSMMMIIHPETQKQFAAQFERSLEDLHFGGIAVNAWAGVIYGMVTLPWGAHPGHTLEDIRSGRGVVHNTYLFDHVQKTILRAPFRMNPTPAWFADHKTQDKLGRALLEFEGSGSIAKVPPVIFAALRG